LLAEVPPVKPPMENGLGVGLLKSRVNVHGRRAKFWNDTLGMCILGKNEIWGRKPLKTQKRKPFMWNGQKNGPPK